MVHLQPMKWRDDGWPVMGADQDGDGCGEPVRTWKKPATRGSRPAAVPATSDEFAARTLGLQWQWQANPRDGWMSLAARPGALRLFSQPAPAGDNLWLVPNVLLQKLPAPEFVATAALHFSPRADGDRAGLLISGQDYAWVGMTRENGQVRLVVRSLKGAKDATGTETTSEVVSGWPRRVKPAAYANPKITLEGVSYLRVTVTRGGVFRFSAGSDLERLSPVGVEFLARAGDWVVPKVGLFALGPAGAAALGYADWDWFRVEPPADSR